MNNLNNLKWITNSWGLIEEHDVFERQEAVYFRKEFNLTDLPQKAELIIYTNGITNIYINGEDVSREYFAPGPSEFTRSYSFRKYDVTSALDKNNAILVIAGDGWYCGEHTQRERAHLVHGVKIAAILTLNYADGREEVLTTDDTWQALRGAIGLNDIYHGEEFDARKPHLEYSVYGYPCDGEKASLTSVHVNEFTEYDIEPVRKISEIIPEFVGMSVNGGRLYDFKQNFAGLIEIKVKGRAGSSVVMRHGEGFTEDGQDVYTKNLRVARATDTYILKGEGEEVYLPTLTYHGFQVAEIKLNGEVELISAKGIVLHTDLKPLGDFKSDNELINKIYSCALWGAKSNMVCIPTDCPQRNERFGWLADAQVFAGTAVNMYDCKAFYDFYLRLVDNATTDGNVPVFVPRIPGIGSLESVFGWSDAVIIIPYTVYLYYGDKSIIEKFVPLMKSYMGFCEAREPGYIQNAMKYGDWLNAGQDTDQKLIATAYYARSAYLLAYMLKEIEDKDSEKYGELFENIKKAYREKFFDANKNRIKKDKESQTAYALSVCFNLLTADETKDGLREQLKKYDDHVMCGFMGANLILPALCECELTDIAYKLALNDTYPSWGYCIEQGATTFWEHWDSYDKVKGYKHFGDEAEMVSLNHYSFGSVVEWFYTHMLGIKPIEPGFKRVKIQPFLSTDKRLSSISGYYDTPYGRISVEWKVTGDRAEIKIVKPKEALAEFVFDNIVSIEQDGKKVNEFNEHSEIICVKIKMH